MELPENLKISAEYISDINTVYNRTKSILANNLFPHYTKHDITHCERILVRINQLIDGTKVNLNDEEKFILICAVLLHDIGMQTTKYIGEDKSVDKLSEDDRNKIRDEHHLFSEKLIIDSIQLDQTHNFWLGLTSNCDFVTEIASVAKNHRKLKISEVSDEPIIIGAAKVRLKLLCALMRLGDCLDIDKRRVEIDQLKNISIETKSKFYWYSHHYVSGLNIDRQKIKVFFKFPKDYETSNSLVTKMFQYIKTEISDQVNEVYSVLDANGIVLHKEIEHSIAYSETVVSKMPVDLINEIMSGLGEIDFYWGGNREKSHAEIINYLKDKDLDEIFIAAIGFGTISTVLEHEGVQKKIQDRISKNNIKITFVLPGGLRDLLNFRQDIDEKDLIKTYQKGQLLLANFKKNISEKCFPEATEEERLEKISKYVEVKQYAGSVPRHFILYGSDDTIFFGAYLSHTTGKKSYIMKLTPKAEDVNENDKLNKGLFNLFKEEIKYIKEHSEVTIIN